MPKYTEIRWHLLISSEGPCFSTTRGRHKGEPQFCRAAFRQVPWQAVRLKNLGQSSAQVGPSSGTLENRIRRVVRAPWKHGVFLVCLSCYEMPALTCDLHARSCNGNGKKGHASLFVSLRWLSLKDTPPQKGNTDTAAEYWRSGSVTSWCVGVPVALRSEAALWIGIATHTPATELLVSIRFYAKLAP